MARLRIALMILAAALLGTTMVVQRGDDSSDVAPPPAQEGPTIVSLVNEAALEVIDNLDRSAPTIVARDLYLVHGAIFEAWAAFDDLATGQIDTIYDDTLAARFPDAQLGRIVLAAAREALLDLTSAASPSTMAPFDGLLARLGVEPVAPGVDTADGVAAVIASSWLDARRDDGSNQAGRFRDPVGSGDPTPSSPPTPAAGTIPGWQPELVATGQALDDAGRPVIDLDEPASYRTTTFLTTHWGRVAPFALANGDEYRSTLDPPGPDSLRDELEALVTLGAELDPESLAAADYWSVGEADGFAPGRWNDLARSVALRDRHREVDDVKLFFALNGALLDASIAATDAQVEYDMGRPVSLVPAILDNAEWRPARPADLGSPASPGYVADDSVYAAAAAQVLEQLKGSSTFATDDPAEEVGRVVLRPETARLPLATEVELLWPTYVDAALQAGLAQQWSGAAIASADEHGRALGRIIGAEAVSRASALWLGLIEPPPG